MPQIHLTWFKAMLENTLIVEKLKKIKLIVADIDGSLTDGTVHYNEQGEADRMFSPQDGHAIRMAIDQNIDIAFLSGNSGASIVSRAKKLKIPHDLVILGSRNKPADIKKLQAVRQTTDEQTAIFGDDDLDGIVKEKEPEIFFAMPKNGVFYLKHLADCVVPANAGHESAFRLFLNLVLYVQKKHKSQHLITQALENTNEKKHCSCSCSC